MTTERSTTPSIETPEDAETGMKTSKIRIAYQGPALRDGTIAVEDLAPSLIALAGAFEQANKALCGKQATVKVLVRADFRPGSFEVSLSVVQTWGAQLLSLFAGNNASGLANLIEVLGFARGTASSGYLSVISVLKKAKGKRPEILAETENGDVVLGIEGDHFVVKKPVAKLLQEKAVIKEIYRAMNPIRSDGVESFEIREAELVEGREAAPIEVITRDDLCSFAPPVEVVAAAPSGHETVFSRKMLLTLVSISFKDGNKWRFSDGEGIVSADMKDESFLSRIESRELTFGKGDVLECELTTRQELQNGSLKSENEIVRVIRHIQPAMQLSLIPTSA